MEQYGTFSMAWNQLYTPSIGIKLENMSYQEPPGWAGLVRVVRRSLSSCAVLRL